MNSNPPLLRLHNATVQRNGKTILHIDDFQLDSGESIAILGPNGSGKSTFVSLLTREVSPLYREDPPVLFRGKERATLDEVKSQIGLVSSAKQNRVSRHVSAIDIVEGGLFGSLVKPTKITLSDDQKRCAIESMRSLGIEHLASRDVTTLSSGEARRVLIARALVNDPDVIVFDEPCTGLDPEGMYYIRNIMNKLVESRKSVLLVTHYPEDIVSSISRVALLKGGHMIDDGAKKDLLTSEKMTELFEVPIRIHEDAGQYSLTYR